MNWLRKLNYATAKLWEIVFSHNGFVRGPSASAGPSGSWQAVPQDLTQASCKLTVRNLVLAVTWDTDTASARLTTLPPLLTQHPGAGQGTLHCLNTCTYNHRP